MRVGIDVSQVVYGTGVAEYTKLLLRYLSQIDSESEYVLFGGSLRRGEELKYIIESLHLGANFKLKQFPISPTIADLLWNKIHAFEIERLIGEVDVFHSSDWTQPPTHAFKVTTVHDLAPILLPQLTPRKVVQTHLARLTRVKESVDRVIVPSKTTKFDLVRFGVDEEKIVVIPEAPAEMFREKIDEKSILEVKRKYRINGRYLIGVGVSLRKNTKRIVEAFERVKTKDLKLVLIGRPQVKLNETRGVIFAGFVADKDRPALFAGAEGLVYPSLYEGFGLPILEAFAAKCPVLTSNNSSMSEVAGKGAVLVDPREVYSITEGLQYLLTHKKTMQKLGSDEVKKYNSLESARKTLEVYREYQKGGTEIKMEGGVQ